VCLFQTSTATARDNCLLNYFMFSDGTTGNNIVNTELIIDDLSYNNMFIKHMPILSSDGMYHISNINSSIGFRTINNLLLKGISDNLKYSIHEGIFSNTLENLACKFVKGVNLVAQITEDNDATTNSDWYIDVLTQGTTIIEQHDMTSSHNSEFLSMLMHENI
jgi:hypothetical protein